MVPLCNSKASLRWGALPPGRREVYVLGGRAGGAMTPKATSAAILAMPVEEGLSLRSNIVTLSRDGANQAGSRAAEQRNDFANAAASSGLDFIDLVGLDERTVWNRQQDAVTYRVLVGCASKPPVTAPHSGAFNVKQLKSYRDNVTRNLAPTVARGFANAARAAGHVLAAMPTPQSQTAAAPPPPRPQQARINTAESTAAAGAAGSAQRQLAQLARARAEATSQTGATFAAPATSSSRHRVPAASLASQSAAVAAELQVAMPPAGPATGRVERGKARVATLASSQSAMSDVMADDTMAHMGGGAPFEDGSSSGGRRRGSRGAGRDVLAGAGRQLGSASASAAWI